MFMSALGVAGRAPLRATISLPGNAERRYDATRLNQSVSPILLALAPLF